MAASEGGHDVVVIAYLRHAMFHVNPFRGMKRHDVFHVNRSMGCDTQVLVAHVLSRIEL